MLPLLTEQVPGLFTTSRGIMGYGCLLYTSVESDLNQEKDAETHFKEAIRLAAQTEEYDQMTQICRRCSLYYQKSGNFDEALEMEDVYKIQAFMRAKRGMSSSFQSRRINRDVSI